MLKISFIAIGNELLKGFIVNTNAARAGQILRNQGLSLHRVLTIGDTKEAIMAAVEAELAESDVVLMSGGLGPTKDDITKYTLAEVFGAKEWKWDQDTLDFLEQRYKERGRSLNELTRGQARVPDVCEVVPNRMGTAPGMLFRRGNKQLYSMPGVPFEMLHLLEHEVIPRLQRSFSTEALTFEFVRIAGIPESEAAGRLEQLEQDLPPEASLAYLPRADGIWLELSMRMPHEQIELATRQTHEIAARIADIFGPAVYARDDRPFSQVVRDTFVQKGLSLAVAESMTGGRVASLLVESSGASRYFKGGVTAYFTQIKSRVLDVSENLIEANGVDSEAVAREMAAQVRKKLNADIGLATTGLAEADGDKGAHVWLGYADHMGTEARHVPLRYNRSINIDRATHYLLQLAMQKLHERL